MENEPVAEEQKAKTAAARRQGWTRTLLAVGITGAFVASQLLGLEPSGLKELSFIAVTFYFTKNDN